MHTTPHDKTTKIAHTSTLISLFALIAIDAMGIGLVWPLFGPLFMGDGTSVVSPHTSAIARDLLYGITMGIFPICMFFGAPILGDLSDHIGRKKVLLICLYGTCFGLVICTFGVIWRSVYLLILGRAILGALAGSQATAQAAIIDISAPERKTISLSIITLAGNLGFIIGPMMGGLLIDKTLVSWFTLTTPFVSSAILAFLNAVILHVVFKETFYPKKINKIYFTKGAKIFIAAFANKNIRLLATIYLCLITGWALSFQFSVVYLVQTHGYPGAKIGYFLAVISACFALSLLTIMRVALRYFKLENIISCAMGIGVIALSLMLLHKEWSTWVGMDLTAACVAIGYTGMLTLLSNSATKDEQGWIMGVGGAVSAASWGVGSLLAGSLGTFHFPVSFLVAALLLFGGLMLMIFERKSRALQ